MMDLIQSTFLQAMGWAVLNSFWQFALLWILYRIITSLLSPGSRNKANLATITIAISFIWFIATFISFYYSNPVILSAISEYLGSSSSFSVSFLNKLFPAAAVLYIIFLIIPVSLFIRNYRYLNLIRNKGLGKADTSWKLFIRKTSSLMGIKRTVAVWVSDFVSSPVTIGFLKPVILIPVAAVNQLSAKQVEAILLHELGHISRNDYIINIIINFIKTLLYFNPFVRMLVSDIEKERENSCDRLVMQFNYNPYDYANALVKLQKMVNEHFYFTIPATGRTHQLLERIEDILGLPKKRLFSLRKLSGLILACLIFLCGSILLTKNNQLTDNRAILFQNSFNPYYFINSPANLNEPKAQPVLAATEPTNSTAKVKTEKKEQDLIFDEEEEMPGIAFAGFQELNAPTLPPKEEAYLKETIKSTQKILKEKEWKNIEKQYADAFTSHEKATLHQLYNEKVNEINWDQLEDKLRHAYGSINWQNINSQLQSSLLELRIDSIQSVLHKSVTDLDELEDWMKINNANTIPDSDITLDKVRELRKKTILAQEKLRLSKLRKTIKI